MVGGQVKAIRAGWLWVVAWFETGDLVPLLVLVSAVHYAAVLRDKDAPIVAVAIGLLVDLGHYRTVRAAVRYNGDDRKQAAVRWIIAVGMTALSLNYHQRYYDDLWLSVPLPLLIAALAWLQRVDRQTGARVKVDAPVIKPDAPTIRIDAPRMRALPAHICAVCGEVQSSQQKLAAHMRWQHAKETTK